MNIEKLREQIRKKEGETLHFKFNGSRNQVEEFTGEIIEYYPAIFLIRLKGSPPKIKSFTYIVLLTESLEIL